MSTGVPQSASQIVHARQYSPAAALNAQHPTLLRACSSALCHSARPCETLWQQRASRPGSAMRWPGGACSPVARALRTSLRSRWSAAHRHTLFFCTLIGLQCLYAIRVLVHSELGCLRARLCAPHHTHSLCLPSCLAVPGLRELMSLGPCCHCAGLPLTATTRFHTFFIMQGFSLGQLGVLQSSHKQALGQAAESDQIQTQDHRTSYPIQVSHYRTREQSNMRWTYQMHP